MDQQRLNRRTFVGMAAVAGGLGACDTIRREGNASEPMRESSESTHGIQPAHHVIFHPASPDDSTMRGFPPPREDLVWLENCESTQATTRWMHRHVRDASSSTSQRKSQGAISEPIIRFSRQA